MSFKTDAIADCLSFIKDTVLRGLSCPPVVMATGVGAVKYLKVIQKTLKTKYVCGGCLIVLRNRAGVAQLPLM